jgi:xylitol oxidase
MARNWSENILFSSTPTPVGTVGDVQSFVKEHDKVRVVGSGHCFHRIADGPNLLNLDAMTAGIELNREASTVTVAAGMRYGQLCPILHQEGFALHNLASLPQISIVGGCATATHGSGDGNQNLAAAVTALELVTAEGDLRLLSRKDHSKIFPGAVVNLGAIGVVTRVTLKIEPAFDVRQDVYKNLRLEQLKDHFAKIMSAGYSVSLFTNWQNEMFSQVWLKRRVEKGVALEAEKEFYGAELATENLHPVTGKPAGPCTQQKGEAGPWFERLPHFRMEFRPSVGEELQSEYFVPRTNAVEAILAIKRLRDEISPHLLVSELRTVAADDLWLSPCYNRPSLAIHFTWKPELEAVQRVLPRIEDALRPFAVRPHWGKLFSLTPAQIEQEYERLADFKELLREFDPQGKFRNSFLDATLFPNPGDETRPTPLTSGG